MLAIPNDAPHPGNAHLFINYLLEPEVIAAVSNYVYYANPNAASAEFVEAEILEDPGIYPTPEVKAKLFPDLSHTSSFTRAQTRAWTRFKTGR
jgi:putrescine transport system substrate-binding protein